MRAASVYYCWSCDAHCPVPAGTHQQAHCKRCGRLLAEEDRLMRPGRDVKQAAAGKQIETPPHSTLA